MSRERAAFGEVMASEMTSRLDIMSKDVQMLTKKVVNVLSFVDVRGFIHLPKRFRRCVAKREFQFSVFMCLGSVCFHIIC